MSFVPQTKINRQVIGSVPVVLNIGAKNVSSLPPLATTDSSAIVGRQSEVKIGPTVTATAAGRGRCCVDSCKVDAP